MNCLSGRMSQVNRRCTPNRPNMHRIAGNAMSPDAQAVRTELPRIMTTAISRWMIIPRPPHPPELRRPIQSERCRWAQQRISDCGLRIAD